MADAVCVAAQNRVGGDVLAKVKVMVKKLKTEALSLRDDLGTERAAHDCTLMHNTRPQRDRKKEVQKKK